MILKSLLIPGHCKGRGISDVNWQANTTIYSLMTPLSPTTLPCEHWALPWYHLCQSDELSALIHLHYNMFVMHWLPLEESMISNLPPANIHSSTSTHLQWYNEWWDQRGCREEAGTDWGWDKMGCTVIWGVVVNFIDLPWHLEVFGSFIGMEEVPKILPWIYTMGERTVVVISLGVVAIPPGNTTRSTRLGVESKGCMCVGEMDSSWAG